MGGKTTLSFSLVLSESPLKVHELKTAQAAGIPIIVVIDNENYNQRDLIDMYSKLGFSFLFEEQVIAHVSEYRKVPNSSLDLQFSNHLVLQYRRAMKRFVMLLRMPLMLKL